jgi:hypothetical protein
MDLTPRSKIRQLIASIDEDSEKENSPFDVGSRVASRPVDIAASDDETDEDIVRRPVRSNTSLVARLAAEAGIQNASSGSEAEENTYERVKRQLLESKQVHTATKESSRIDSESDDIPIAARSNTRRRTMRPARSSSPVVPSSPGLFVSPEKTRSSPHATRLGLGFSA